MKKLANIAFGLVISLTSIINAYANDSAGQKEPIELANYSIAKVTSCVSVASEPHRCRWVSRVEASAFVRGWITDDRPVATAWFLQDGRVIPIPPGALVVLRGSTGLMVRISQEISMVPMDFSRPESDYVGKPVRLKLQIGEGLAAKEFMSDGVIPAIAS